MSQENRVRPVTPDEASDMKMVNIPDVVIETVNRLLAENMRLGRAVIKQKDLVDELVSGGLDKGEIYDRGWVDFEDLYREYGWKVHYDKPGWNEDYPAFWEFTVPNPTSKR